MTCEYGALQDFEPFGHLARYALIILDYCEAVMFHETCCLDQVVNTENLTASIEYENEIFAEELVENKINQRCYPFTTCKPAMSVLPVKKNARIEIDSMSIPYEEIEDTLDDFDSRTLSLQLLEIEKSILEERYDIFEQTVTNVSNIPFEHSERFTFLSTDSHSTIEKAHSSRKIRHCNSLENYNRIQEIQNISVEEFDSSRWRKHSSPNNKTELTVKVPPWLRNVSPRFTTHDSVLNENTPGSENEIVINEKRDIQGDACKYEVREKSVRELLNLAEEVERRFTEKTEQIESLENLLQSELTSLESDLAVVSEIHRSLCNESDILQPVDLFSDKVSNMTIESEKHDVDLIDFDKTLECTEQKKSNQEEYAPEIITHLQNRVVQSGNRTRLYCSISGKPDPQVVWLKNGKILPKSTRHIFNNLMEFGFYIDIYNAMSSDSGMYTCIATNCNGVAQTQAYLRVIGKREFSPEEPKFLKSPGDIKVNVGETVTLEWKISGTPVPNVIWFKNAEKIETSLKLDAFSNHRGCCRLVLHDVTAEDCAIYSCYLENEAGSSVSTVLVSVSDGTNESAIIPDNSDVVLNVREKCYILDDLDLSLLDLEERLRKEALLLESMPFKRTMNEEPKGVPLIPGRPFAPTTVSVGCTWAILSWTVPLDYRERDSTLIYRIEKRRLSSNRWKEIGRTKNTVYTAHGLKSGKSYAFRISAGNREGWGPAATLPHPVNCSS
ncbi:muscle M-line assembly protein unc-89-like [Uloborus diversus]|uniref:muscle M-line assembly protein unc-89-like n=1 Tax=Uloborus diversus TaxID=327109 RepID=UPI002409D454|nr:muscle M-line assembly protein unc-89-like [Uloborus diversus]